MLKILVFNLGVKKQQIFVRGGSQEKLSDRDNIFGKMSEVGKIIKINCPSGVKWLKKVVRGG